MNEVKNKLFDFETIPPEGVWNAIVAELDNSKAKVIALPKKRNHLLYYAAASVFFIVLSLLLFTNRSSNSVNEKLITSSPDTSTHTNNVIITVPTDDRSIVKNNNEKLPDKNVIQQQKRNGVIKIKPKNENILLASNSSRYITIDGPQGQPVKISSKMASLIDSSETKISSKPIWNKKVNEWREIMKSNTLAPTTGNFLDIVELARSLKDNK